ncbi:MAG: hypothetical protein KC475_12680 [Cyanobacteria bacterium HKST-UBA03]|nr:hypothetical protein [Cyanobacteria bacterium HKST-UBA03]
MAKPSPYLPSLLVVDDEYASPLAEALEAHGFTKIWKAGDTQEAMACVARYQPDMVLIDKNLGRGPHNDGQVLVRALLNRGVHPNRLISISGSEAMGLQHWWSRKQLVFKAGHGVASSFFNRVVTEGLVNQTILPLWQQVADGARFRVDRTDVAG